MLAREVAFHIITYFIDVLMINLIDMSNKVQVWPNSLFRLVIIRSPKQLRRAQYISTTVGTKLLNAVTMSVNYFVRRISLRHGVS